MQDIVYSSLCSYPIQDIVYSSLCSYPIQAIIHTSLLYTVGPCLSVSYTLMCTVNHKLLIIPPPPSPLVAVTLFSMYLSVFHFVHKFIYIICLDSTYVFVLLFLTSLSLITSRSIHIATNGSISFSLAEQCSTVYMYHIFFIHASV